MKAVRPKDVKIGAYSAVSLLAIERVKDPMQMVSHAVDSSYRKCMRFAEEKKLKIYRVTHDETDNLLGNYRVYLTTAWGWTGWKRGWINQRKPK